MKKKHPVFTRPALLKFTAPAAAICLFTRCGEAPEKQPNIVLIVADDLGYTDLGCYGSSFYETPNLDQLAVEGLRFTDGYATCPVCSPTRSSLMTGKHQVKTGVTDWIPGRSTYANGVAKDRWIAPDTETEMDLEETTIAEVLKSKGYRTFFAGKWHLGQEEKYWPRHQGFDINKGGNSRGAPKRNAHGCGGYFAPYCNPRLEDGPEGEYLPDRLAEETVTFLDTAAGKPFFVYLPFYLVHNPQQGKDEIIRRFEKKRQEMGLDEKEEFIYDKEWMKYASAREGENRYRERIVQGSPVYASMVWSLDENIGKVIDKLKEMGMYENTVILFTSDNGGLATSEGSPTCNLPLRAGKGWLYEGGIREPFILLAPGMEPSSRTVETPVSSIDVFPTLLSYAGVDAGEYGLTDGIDIRSCLETGQWPDRALFWHYPHYSNQGGNPGSVIREGKYKLVHDFETGARELYDLSEDIGEQHDIAGDHPEVVERLWNKLEEWRTTNDAKMMLRPNPDWDGMDPVVE